MAFETKEQVLEKVLKQKKPVCPHCNKEMDLWEVPPIAFSDGLGWGVPYMFVCFNDECPQFEKGWEEIMDNYGHRASCRCICYPGSKTFEYMPVFSKIGATEQIINEEVLLQQEVLKENIKKGFSILAGCYVEKDSVTTLRILLDPCEPAKVRLKAAEIIGDIGELEALEPIKNVKFPNQIMQKEVDEAIKKIHKKTFTRECPYCAEIIKIRAKICKHCGKDTAGL